MSDENPAQVPVSSGDNEKIIQRLTDEKKSLEEKNRRFAAILEITAKNVSKLNAQESDASKDDGAGSGVASQVASIKKEIGSLERKIEKSKSAQSSEQLNAILAELKPRFDKLDERLNMLDKIVALEKKLGDIEDAITLRKKSNANLFGGLGSIGGAGDSGEAKQDAEGEEANSSGSDDFGKLDEINLKLDALSKRLDDLHIGAEKHSFSDSLKKIIPSFREKSHDYAAGEPAPAEEDSEEPGFSKPADVSSITFKKVEPGSGPKEDKSYVSLQTSDSNSLAGEGIKFKVHAPEHFLDFKKIPEDIREGHVVLLNVKSLKEQGTDELRHFVEKVKRISDGISGRVMGIGEHHIIVLPKKVAFHQDLDKN